MGDDILTFYDQYEARPLGSTGHIPNPKAVSNKCYRWSKQYLKRHPESARRLQMARKKRQNRPRTGGSRANRNQHREITDLVKAHSTNDSLQIKNHKRAREGSSCEAESVGSHVSINDDNQITIGQQIEDAEDLIDRPLIDHKKDIEENVIDEAESANRHSPTHVEDQMMEIDDIDNEKFVNDISSIDQDNHMEVEEQINHDATARGLSPVRDEEGSNLEKRTNEWDSENDFSSIDNGNQVGTEELMHTAESVSALSSIEAEEDIMLEKEDENGECVDDCSSIEHNKQIAEWEQIDDAVSVNDSV